MIVAVVLCAAPAWLSQVVTYGTLLNVCRGHWEVALQLLRDMHRQKIVPWTSSGDVLDWSAMVKLAISYNAYKCSSYITHYDDILLALLEYREKSVRAYSNDGTLMVTWVSWPYERCVINWEHVALNSIFCKCPPWTDYVNKANRICKLWAFLAAHGECCRATSPF